MKYIKIYSKGNEFKISVDIDDYDKVSSHKWHLSGGYAYTRIGKRNVSMHRMIMNTPDGMVTDHINHDKLDNRKCNLRVVTHEVNMANREKPVKYVKITERGSIKKITLHNGKYTYFYGELRQDGKRYTTVTCDKIEQAQGALKQMIKMIPTPHKSLN